MREPEIPRGFKLDVPLYDEASSPWNEKLQDDYLKPAIDSQRQLLTTFNILHQFSWEALAKDQARFQQLQQEGQTESDEYKALDNAIPRQQEKLGLNGGTDRRGATQTPQVACGDYSFPIFPVARDGSGQRVTDDLQMLTYDEKSYKPPYLPRERTNGGWIAKDVPRVHGEVRPSGPAKSTADGAVVLYDPETHEEFDFYQVTTKDENKALHGAGHSGDQIVRAGSASRFDTRGSEALGARVLPGSQPRESCRASGLPYLGGLLLPEDFAAGKDSVIEHALAFVLPSLRHFPLRAPSDAPDFVYPATSTETICSIQSPYALAAGQRIRLKATIRTWDGRETKMNEWKKLPHVVRIFLTAFHDYGAYLVDGGGGFVFAAEDQHTASIDAGMVQTLIGDNKILTDETPWQALIGTINEYLSYKLFEAEDDYESIGLPLGFYEESSNGSASFYSNLEVVEDLDSPT